jgi:phosphohistidine swiveling domain-containing protein
MDIEWGKDGDRRQALHPAGPARDGEEPGGQPGRAPLQAQGPQCTVLAEGRAIGQKIGTGPVRLVSHISEMDKVQPGDVLVTDMTDPNWEPVMKRASAIVTNRGGRTCHAAIIARELGIPAVVGCGDATEHLQDGQLVTVVCSEGDTGFIYDGLLETEITEVKRGELPYCPVKIMMNVGNPHAGLRLCPDAQQRRGPGAAGIHHQQQHRRAPEGDPRLPEHRPRPEEGGGIGGAWPCQPAGVLRRQAGRGRRHHRRGLLAQVGDRAAVRLQEQRVPQADRRQPLRARRREPDAGLPRRQPLHQRRASPMPSRWSARRSSACATTWA